MHRQDHPSKRPETAGSRAAPPAAKPVPRQDAEDREPAPYVPMAGLLGLVGLPDWRWTRRRPH